MASRPLLQLVADEIAEMYARPKQLIQMPIQETVQALNIDILGNFQDTVNTYGGAVRVFAMNRGEFDVKNRKWDIDLFEIGTGAVVETETVKTIKYGFLYNWYAVNTGMLAASGWAVPTHDDFDTLRIYLGGASVAGTKLRESGTTYWEIVSPYIEGTNDVNFDGRGAGFRHYSTAAFSGIRQQLMLWCTDADPNCYYSFTTGSTDYLYLFDGFDILVRKQGMSIRLVRAATESEQLLDDGTACDDYVGNDGQHYNTVKVGTQVWTSENLIETLYSDSTPINYVPGAILWTATTDGAYCYYDNDITNAYTETEEVIGTSSTADSTVVTADSTVITSDSTV
jgi:uncharacterized protein (TIGR02145 family)